MFYKECRNNDLLKDLKSQKKFKKENKAFFKLTIVFHE